MTTTTEPLTIYRTLRHELLPKPAAQPSVIDTITKLADTYTLRWVLIHTSEGVVWGEYDPAAKNLDLSSDAFPELAPMPTWGTILQARLFNTQAELYMWNGAGNQWQWRLYSDSEQVPATETDSQATVEGLEYYDEDYRLWGTRVDGQQGRFMRLAEGTQGIIHAPPLSIAPTERQRIKLKVRHYLRPDINGLLQVDDSRLVAL
ncbi:MAG: TIGR03984 family CRISPR-associated protein [Blastochloris sp.]|nr:TIGR03984 family CRISPR-associated protein [Blastochloris sp.]